MLQMTYKPAKEEVMELYGYKVVPRMNIKKGECYIVKHQSGDWEWWYNEGHGKGTSQPYYETCGCNDVDGCTCGVEARNDERWPGFQEEIRQTIKKYRLPYFNKKTRIVEKVIKVKETYYDLRK